MALFCGKGVRQRADASSCFSGITLIASTPEFRSRDQEQEIVAGLAERDMARFWHLVYTNVPEKCIPLKMNSMCYFRMFIHEKPVSTLALVPLK